MATAQLVFKLGHLLNHCRIFKVKNDKNQTKNELKCKSKRHGLNAYHVGTCWF